MSRLTLTLTLNSQPSPSPLMQLQRARTRPRNTHRRRTPRLPHAHPQCARKMPQRPGAHSTRMQDTSCTLDAHPRHVHEGHFTLTSERRWYSLYYTSKSHPSSTFRTCIDHRQQQDGCLPGFLHESLRDVFSHSIFDYYYFGYLSGQC